MPDRLAEIRARLDAAYPGPLLAGTRTLHAAHEQMVSEIDGKREFIAHATADIAWLLDEVERLRGEA